jgi:3-oxoacyl-[acyl-carrier protein] reductase
MMRLLEGKTGIITGASKGIGKATAELFAKNGANLFLLSRDIGQLTILSNYLQDNFGIKAFAIETDVRDLENIKNAFRVIRDSKMPIDILVNNAGILEDATLLMVKEDTIENIFKTNVFGVIHITQLAIKLLIRQRKGSIINLSSIVGISGNHGQSVYSSSKSAIIGFTRSMSKELAPLGVRVNAIAPGFIDTDMTRNMDVKYYEQNLASIGMGRIGKPEDVANAILFLASDLSEYITGQIIGVDGGMVL